jgi:hypothetical protein
MEVEGLEISSRVVFLLTPMPVCRTNSLSPSGIATSRPQRCGV